MNRTFFLLLLSWSVVLIPHSIYAGSRPELRLTNKTNVVISEIILVDLDKNQTSNHFLSLPPNSTTTVKLNRDSHRYDVIMIDVNRHSYGVKNRRFPSDKNQLEISHKDYIYEGIGSLIKRMFDSFSAGR